MRWCWTHNQDVLLSKQGASSKKYSDISLKVYIRSNVTYEFVVYVKQSFGYTIVNELFPAVWRKKPGKFWDHRFQILTSCLLASSSSASRKSRVTGSGRFTIWGGGGGEDTIKYQRCWCRLLPPLWLCLPALGFTPVSDWVRPLLGQTYMQILKVEILQAMHSLKWHGWEAG